MHRRLAKNLRGGGRGRNSGKSTKAIFLTVRGRIHGFLLDRELPLQRAEVCMCRILVGAK